MREMRTSGSVIAGLILLFVMIFQFYTSEKYERFYGKNPSQEPVWEEMTHDSTAKYELKSSTLMGEFLSKIIRNCSDLTIALSFLFELVSFIRNNITYKGEYELLIAVVKPTFAYVLANTLY